MKILFDARLGASGPMHGHARYIVNLLERFPALAPDLKFHLLVHRSELDSARQRFPGYPLVPTWTRTFQPADLLEIPWLALRHRPAVFHFPSIMLSYCWPARSVITMHDLIPLFLAPDLRMRLYTRFVLGPVSRGSHHIFAGSRNTMQDAIRLLGLRPHNVTAGCYGVEPNPVVADRPQTRARYGLPGPFLMCVTNTGPHKNFAFLLRTFAALELPLQLLLVCPRSPELDELVAADPRVIRIHGIPEADLQALMAEAWALVLPSLHEGFGLPPAEAMVHGTPVLVSNTSAMPEVVGEAGLLFDPRDPASLRAQLERLWDDAELRERLSRAGPEWVKRLSWDQVAARHVEVYRDRGGLSSR